MNDEQVAEAIEVLNNDQLVIAPTDTIYGILARASSKGAVDAVYKIRKRQNDKPCIVLISHIEQLKIFGVSSLKQQEARTYWPAAVSLVLPVRAVQDYLTKGKTSLAFRLPDNDFLQKVIEKAGPLIAPSANLAGDPPVETIEQAKTIFGEAIGLYLDGGTVHREPSILLSLEHEQPRRLR